jgi:hypothetical protein
MLAQTLSLSSEIDAYMVQSGVRNPGWYVGITSDVQERLFGHHRVDRTKNWWIYRRCANASEARDLEAAYHRAGCKGSGGGGDAGCVHIYAYVITPTTVE